METENKETSENADVVFTGAELVPKVSENETPEIITESAMPTNTGVHNVEQSPTSLSLLRDTLPGFSGTTPENQLETKKDEISLPKDDIPLNSLKPEETSSNTLKEENTSSCMMENTVNSSEDQNLLLIEEDSDSDIDEDALSIIITIEGEDDDDDIEDSDMIIDPQRLKEGSVDGPPQLTKASELDNELMEVGLEDLTEKENGSESSSMDANKIISTTAPEEDMIAETSGQQQVNDKTSPEINGKDTHTTEKSIAVDSTETTNTQITNSSAPPSSSSSLTVPNEIRSSPQTLAQRSKQSNKVKQFFTTLQTYGNKVSQDVAEQVQELITALVVSEIPLSTCILYA